MIAPEKLVLFPTRLQSFSLSDRQAFRVGIIIVRLFGKDQRRDALGSEDRFTAIHQGTEVRFTTEVDFTLREGRDLLPLAEWALSQERLSNVLSLPMVDLVKTAMTGAVGRDEALAES